MQRQFGPSLNCFSNLLLFILGRGQWKEGRGEGGNIFLMGGFVSYCMATSFQVTALFFFPRYLLDLQMTTGMDYAVFHRYKKSFKKRKKQQCFQSSKFQCADNVRDTSSCEGKEGTDTATAAVQCSCSIDSLPIS